MKWIKKVATTPLSGMAKVIDSLQAQANERKNAPSIHTVREALDNLNNNLNYNIEQAKTDLTQDINQTEEDLTQDINDLNTTLTGDLSDMQDELNDMTQQLEGMQTSLSNKIKTYMFDPAAVATSQSQNVFTLEIPNFTYYSTVIGIKVQNKVEAYSYNYADSDIFHKQIKVIQCDVEGEVTIIFDEQYGYDPNSLYRIAFTNV